MHFSFWRQAALVIAGCLVLIAALSGCGTKPLSKQSVESTHANGSPNEPQMSASTNGSSLVDPKTVSREERLSQAVTHQGEGKFREASEALRELLVNDPKDYEVLFHLANTEAAQRKFSLAIDLLSEIPHDHPDAGVPALGVSAGWCIESERYQDAEQRYRQILKIDPSIHFARRSLAFLLNRQGRRHEANELIRELCVAGDVMQDELHALIVESDAMYDPPGTQPAADARAYWPIGEMGHARQLFTEKRYLDAARLLRPIIESGDAPDAVIAFYGVTVAESQDDQQFDWWLGLVNESVKALPEYWAAAGTYLLREAKYEQALRALAEAVRLDPTDLRSTRRIFQAYRSLNQPQAADVWIDRYGLMNRILASSIAIANANTPDDDRLRDLVRDLDLAGRHLEAIMWRSVAATGKLDEAQQRRDLNKLHHEIVTSHKNAFPSLAERWCGMDLGDQPLPILSLNSDAVVNRESKQQFRLEPPSKVASISFRDVSGAIGLKHNYRIAKQPKAKGFAIYQAYGGGVAVIDFDLDGQLDLYLAQGAADSPEFVAEESDLLYRTIATAASRRVIEVTELANLTEQGYTVGVTAGDWNQDGFPDLAATGIGINRLLINRGDGTFQSKALDSVADFYRSSTSLAMADVTGDQLPDLFVLNYLRDPDIAKVPQLDPAGNLIDAISPLSVKPTRDQLYANTREGQWRVSEVGDDASSGCTGLGIVVTNLLTDHDGNEVFVGNDVMRNQLWARNADGNFVDLATALGCAYGSLGSATGSMGIAAGDFDRTGTVDLHVSNYLNEPVSMYINRDGFFRDLNVKFGLDRASTPVVGFGTQAIDCTNNGWLDLVVTNGHVDDLEHRGEPFQQFPQLFANLGDHFELVNLPDVDYWSKPHLGRALARLDFDRDGQMDFVVTDLREPTRLLLNKSPTTNHWVSIRLVGTSSERDAIGATVELDAGRQHWTSWATAGDGYLCKNESVVHFGIGNEASIQRAVVTWPNGQTQTFENIPIDNQVLLTEGELETFVLSQVITPVSNDSVEKHGDQTGPLTTGR